MEKRGLPNDSAMKYMKRNFMHFDTIDLGIELPRYIKQMNEGLRGRGMLPMLPTYIHGKFSIAGGRTALAVDVGGTHLRIAMVSVDCNGDVVVEGLKKAELPGLKEKISYGWFFNALAGHIAPYAAHADIIGFSFSHRMQHLNNTEGMVLSLSKELCVKGIENKKLADNLKNALGKFGISDTKIVVLNDTVGVAASMAYKTSEYDSFVGLVLGTGTNTCYIEDSKNIRKISCADTPSMFINVESAEYVPKGTGVFDAQLNSMTDLPGAGQLEKMISGRYIGNLLWLALKQAAKESLLSQNFSMRIHNRGALDTIAMSDFLANPYGSGIYAKMCTDEADRSFLYTVAETLVKRGAKLIALEIAGAAMKTGKGRDKSKPICVIAEGTTYDNLPGLKQEVGRLLKTWFEKNEEVYVRVKQIDNAAIKGIGLIGISYL